MIKKNCRIVSLFTKEPSILHITKSGKLFTTAGYTTRPIVIGGHYDKSLHIYVVSTDPIKAGEWKYDSFHKSVTQVKSITQVSGYDTKVIATTDKSLEIRLGGNIYDDEGVSFQKLPKIARYFLNDLVNNAKDDKPVFEVEVEYEDDKPKVYPDNTINMWFKKNNWNREEVEKLLIYCTSAVAAHFGHVSNSLLMRAWNEETKKWINENL